MKKPVKRKFNTLIGLFLLLVTATGLNLGAFYSNITLATSADFHSESNVSSSTAKVDFQFDMSSDNENLHHSHWFENNEREEKEERDELVALLLVFVKISLDTNQGSLDSSIKSFAQSITNIPPIPLYDFQHSWRVYCA